MPHQSGRTITREVKFLGMNEMNLRGARRNAVQSGTVTAIARPICMPLAYKYVIQFIMIYLRLVSTSVVARRHAPVSAPVGIGTLFWQGG
jgi:hypothetical protein